MDGQILSSKIASNENNDGIFGMHCFRNHRFSIGSCTSISLVAIALLWFAPSGFAKAKIASRTMKVSREVKPLPGRLDEIPVFNSNSPEVVGNGGILLSTFPAKLGPAHLDYSFNGRFDVFLHHIANGLKGDRKEELYLGLLAGNVGDKTVHVEVLDGASYLSRQDAPFIALPAVANNDRGKVFAGPGDRVTLDLLRDKQGAKWRKRVEILPGQVSLVETLAIPVSKVKPHLNGRTYMAQLQSDGPIRLALVAQFVRPKRRVVFLSIFAPLILPIPRKIYRSPKEDEFIETFQQGNLVRPRDVKPSSSDNPDPIKYGRVSGVSIGSTWTGNITDSDFSYLTLPEPGRSISFAVSSLRRGTFGTGQIQSAPLAVRYSDTAYEANGNYGVKYVLDFPLRNSSDAGRVVELALETPIKSDSKQVAETFLDPPSTQVFFRGTVKVSDPSGDTKNGVHYFHLVQHRGEEGPPFTTISIPARQDRAVRLEFFYPPDCTPPHLLTLTVRADDDTARD